MVFIIQAHYVIIISPIRKISVGGRQFAINGHAVQHPFIIITIMIPSTLHPAHKRGFDGFGTLGASLIHRILCISIFVHVPPNRRLIVMKYFIECLAYSDIYIVSFYHMRYNIFPIPAF